MSWFKFWHKPKAHRERCWNRNEELEADTAYIHDNGMPVYFEVDETPGGGSGWSTTVGELRAMLADLPDDTEVMLQNAEVDDIDISGIGDATYLPSDTETSSPGLLVIDGGQKLNFEYNYDRRMDVAWESDDVIHTFSTTHGWETIRDKRNTKW